MSLDDVKRDVAIANRILNHLGLAAGTNSSVGHASMRVPDSPGHFVVKGRGYDMDNLGTVRPEDMVVCDLEGYKVDGPEGISQCYEVKMHSCIYRARPDVQSVVHVHPQYIILMSVLGRKLRPMNSSGGQIVRKGVPIYPRSKLILMDEDGSEVARLMGDGRAVMLKGHGAVTCGASLQDAVLGMHSLEQQAYWNMLAWNLAGPDHPYLEDELLDESAIRHDYSKIDHFKDSFVPERRASVGPWRYFVEKVSQDL